METKHKKYDKYKPSGVEWLGEVPEHWDVKRLKYMTSINDEALAESTPSDYEILYVDIGNVDFAKGITKKELMVFEEAPSRARRIVQNGDTIVSTVRTYLRAIAPIKIAEDNLIVSTGFAVVRPREINSNYLSYALRSPYFVETVVSRSVGVSYPAINASDLATIEITLPNISEQETISDFLDRRTGQIDELIAKKQRVIELLGEKRTALINHAVTKGLNSDVKMKDSGVDWLGKVPEHWEVKRLKRVSKRIQTGCTPPTAQEYYYEDGTISWYGPGNFGDDLILGEASKLINESAIKDGVARLFEAGSTMIVAIGATIGKVGYIDKRASSNQQITAVAPNIAKVLGKFLAYQLKRLEEVLKGIAPNTTLPIMDQQKIGCLVIAIPPISEQQAITDFLDRETSKIDVLIAKVTEAIEKLKEYRTALISAAVTGKIDVRQEVSV